MPDENRPIDAAEEARLPWQQVLLDDIFLLVTVGLVVPTLFYIVWGLMELASVPLFKP